MRPDGDGERRSRAHWGPIIGAVIGLAVPGLIAWGVTQGQVSAHGGNLMKHDQRLDLIENTYIRDRDLVGVHDRLRRIETQLDQLLSRGRGSPAP